VPRGKNCWQNLDWLWFSGRTAASSETGRCPQERLLYPVQRQIPEACEPPPESQKAKEETQQNISPFSMLYPVRIDP
jgi:hypothetical protein